MFPISHLQFPDTCEESASPFVFICTNPQELVVKFPMKGKHKICKSCRQNAADQTRLSPFNVFCVAPVCFVCYKANGLPWTGDWWIIPSTDSSYSITFNAKKWCINTTIENTLPLACIKKLQEPSLQGEFLLPGGPAEDGCAVLSLYSVWFIMGPQQFSSLCCQSLACRMLYLQALLLIFPASLKTWKDCLCSCVSQERGSRSIKGSESLKVECCRSPALY